MTDEREHAVFRQRLEQSLGVLRELVSRPPEHDAEMTVGAELEMFLITPEGDPAPVNDRVLRSVTDPRVSLEVNRYNLEVNPSPVGIRGRPFSALHAATALLLRRVRTAGAPHGTRPLLIGMLPTLRPEHLSLPFVSDHPRYRSLEQALARRRGHRFSFRIEGGEGLRTYGDSLGLQGAACSWQIHLRVPPRSYTRFYNAAQLAVAPVLAACGNSPLPLGKSLWEETRIPWYERGFGERVVPGTRPRVSFGRDWLRAGALELFTDTVRGHEPLLHTLSDEEPRAAVRGGRTPRLAELRTQQSTVWSWNRPVYDPADGGHLRIEFRALPSGPTLTDIVANAAFLLGLVLDVASEDLEPAAHVPFALARADFYAAARFGLESRLHWPFAPSGHAVPHRAAGLVLGLLPHAARGLRRAGVHPDEAGRWLAVVEERVRTGRTGARWQRAMLDAQSPARCRQAAAHALVRRYQALSEPDLPVHTWPEEAAARGVPG